MKIDNAIPQHASLIADAILDAVGPDITNNLAGNSHTVKDIHALFQRLAERNDTQYSYLNTRVATDDDGSPIGVCICYDGAELKTLRRPFFHEANTMLGWNMTADEIDALPGEAEPDEVYLDTILVLPQYRGQGVAKALIGDAREKAARIGKPLGLLCDIDNTHAYKLYESVGFKSVGLKPFAGHTMYHMQMR